MRKRLSWALAGVVALSLALSGVAFAEEGGPTRDAGTRWGGGEVTAVGTDNLTVRGRLDRELVLYVDANTTITDRDGQPLAFSDVRLGDRVLWAASADGDLWRAVVLHVFPPRTHYKGGGVVSAVEADEFTFVNRRGRVWEFYVDGDTQITDRQGQPRDYSEIQVGTHLFVSAELRADGKWWATEIKIGRPLGRAEPISPGAG